MKPEPHLWVVEQFIDGEWRPSPVAWSNRGQAIEWVRERRTWQIESGLVGRYRIVKYQRVPR